MQAVLHQVAMCCRHAQTSTQNRHGRRTRPSPAPTLCHLTICTTLWEGMQTYLLVLCSGCVSKYPSSHRLRCCAGAPAVFILEKTQSPAACVVEPFTSHSPAFTMPAPKPVQQQGPSDIHIAVVQQHTALLSVLTAQYIKVRSDTQVAHHAELPRVWAGPYWMEYKPSPAPP